MRSLLPISASLAALTAALLVPHVARADCAAPRSYTTRVQGDSVTICPTNPDTKNAAGCPVAGGMLRRDTQTGEVVKLADVCTDAGASGCYVDECVPPGTYQYGYGAAYECCTSCCGTKLASDDVTVAPGTGACASDAGSPTVADAAPWMPSNPSICNYQPSGPQPLPDAGGDGGAHGGDGGADGGAADGAGGGSSGGGGCSFVRAPSVEHSVLAIDGLAALVGLTLFARRRRASR